MDTKATWPALRITLIYMVVAAVWIIASDQVLGLIAPGVVWLNMSKGLFFVGITGTLLYSLMNGELNKLGESQAKIRSQALLLDQVSDAIISTDMNFVVRTFNAAAERIYGWTAEEMIGKQFNEVVRTEYYDRATTRQQAIEEFINKGFWRGEVMQRRKNGELGNFMAATSFIVGANGEREGVVTVNRDISEVKKVAQRLDESEAKFTQAFRSSPVGLAITSMDGRFVEINSALCDMLGYTYSEVLGKTTLELNLITAEARQRLMEVARISQEHIHQIEIATHSKQGEPLDLMLASDKIMLDGEPHRLISIFDLTERKRTEQALRDSEERFRMLIDVSPVAMFVNRDGTIDYGNPAFLRLVGAESLDQIVGKSPFDLFPPEDHEIIRQRIRAIFETGMPAPIRDQKVHRLDGTTREVEVTALGFKDRQGDAIQVVLHDITERKRAEMRAVKLNRTYSVLSSINEAIVRFRSPDDLFQRACDIAVENGGFKMAWIGLRDSETGLIRVGGTNTGMRDVIERLLAEIKPETQGNLPLMQALSSGTPTIINDVGNDDRIETFRDRALKMGFGSLATFPLVVSGKVCGAFSLYAPEVKFFDDEEVRLLTDLAHDIAFAMEVSELETQRQEAERKVRESHERFQNTLDHMMEGCQIIDFDWRYYYINNMAADHGRMDKDALLGQRMMDAYPGIEQTEMFGELRQCMDTREAKRMVNEFVYADSDRRWFELSIQPAQEGIFILSTDITARKLAEDRIQEQAEDLRKALKEKDDAYSLLDTLMRSAPVGLAFIDQDLRYQRINESLAEINGIPVVDHIGCRVEELLPELAPTVVPLFLDIMATRRPTLNLEISGETPRAPGQQRDWLASYYPVLASDDRVLGVGLVVLEITERKRAEQEIRDLNSDLERRVAERTAQLEARTREMESFSYSVSHDLKAPLRGIDGYSRLLLEEHLSSLNDEGQMFVRTIRQGAQQMNQLIEDLLSYSRMERRELGNVSVNPRVLIETMIAERHHDLEKFKVNMDITCADVSVDREGLSIALRNVVDNAIKFTQDAPEPAIDIVGRDTPTTCVITVKDNGVGFDMKFRDRIFAIFQRLHRMEEYPGTGIGLAIVRKAVERLGGKVWAESEPGHGATFILELPRIPSP